MLAELREFGDIIIVDLDGRLVAGPPVETLRQTMNQLIVEGRRKILLNLSQVDWIDSSGIGELVALIKKAEQLQSSVRLLRLGDRVRHVLSVSKLLPLIHVYEDEDEALERFGKDGQ